MVVEIAVPTHWEESVAVARGIQSEIRPVSGGSVWFAGTDPSTGAADRSAVPCGAASVSVSVSRGGSRPGSSPERWPAAVGGVQVSKRSARHRIEMFPVPGGGCAQLELNYRVCALSLLFRVGVV